MRRIRKNRRHVFGHGHRPFNARRKRFAPKLAAPTGIHVRSKLEQEAVALFEKNDIECVYEPLLLLDNKKYRPDFYLPAYDLFIEICGYSHMPFYRDRTAHKREIYAKYNINAEFIMAADRKQLESALRRILPLKSATRK